jgi:hypothetical protein
MSAPNPDDVSKLFPYAASLLGELRAEAVVVLVYGSPIMNGCAPALVLDQTGSAEGMKRNARIVRTVAAKLSEIGGRLESDVVKGGLKLEARS